MTDMSLTKRCFPGRVQQMCIFFPVIFQGLVQCTYKSYNNMLELDLKIHNNIGGYVLEMTTLF